MSRLVCMRVCAYARVCVYVSVYLSMCACACASLFLTVLHSLKPYQVRSCGSSTMCVQI